MHVIARPAIRQASNRHRDAEGWLESWLVTAERARWESLEDVRRDYPSADQYDRCLVFNARGNRYRFVVRVSYADEYQRGTLLIKHFLTHAEYDKDRWKEDCAE